MHLKLVPSPGCNAVIYRHRPMITQHNFHVKNWILRVVGGFCQVFRLFNLFIVLKQMEVSYFRYKQEYFLPTIDRSSVHVSIDRTRVCLASCFRECSTFPIANVYSLLWAISIGECVCVFGRGFRVIVLHDTVLLTCCHFSSSLNKC